MKKLLQYIIIRLTTRHASTAASIFDKIFNPALDHPILIISHPIQGSSIPASTDQANYRKLPVNKKQEIMEALKYLKSKDIKSKQDKGSISMLEGVLGTMS